MMMLSYIELAWRRESLFVLVTPHYIVSGLNNVANEPKAIITPLNVARKTTKNKTEYSGCLVRYHIEKCSRKPQARKKIDLGITLKHYISSSSSWANYNDARVNRKAQ